MPRYRITIRYGAPAARYEMIDVEAADLREALRAAADRMTDEVSTTAELAEVRAQRAPEARAFGPE